MPIVVICAWCSPQHVIETKPGPRLISHGMCRAAKAKALAELAALPEIKTCPHGDTKPAMCAICLSENGRS